jgi:hypothetical protein
MASANVFGIHTAKIYTFLDHDRCPSLNQREGLALARLCCVKMKITYYPKESESSKS